MPEPIPKSVSEAASVPRRPWLRRGTASHGEEGGGGRKKRLAKRRANWPCGEVFAHIRGKAEKEVEMKDSYRKNRQCHKAQNRSKCCGT